MGMVRFAEWLREEGQPGSTELLQYYKDVRSQAVLMQEVKVSSQHGECRALLTFRLSVKDCTPPTFQTWPGTPHSASELAFSAPPCQCKG